MQTKTIQKVYGKGVESYEKIMAKYWPASRKEFIYSLDFREGDKVLEAVVGTGLDLPFFQRGIYVTGIDITSGMLEEARKKETPANVELREMDIHSMDFSDDCFDGAVSTFTLCVVENPRKALEEILRVTKAGSTLGILDYCKSENPDTIKWQELFHYHASNIGFPKNVIVWNSLMDYDKLIYDSGLPIEVVSDQRKENENPFLTTCSIILRNRK